MIYFKKDVRCYVRTLTYSGTLLQLSNYFLRYSTYEYLVTVVMDLHKSLPNGCHHRFANYYKQCVYPQNREARCLPAAGESESPTRLNSTSRTAPLRRAYRTQRPRGAHASSVQSESRVRECLTCVRE